MKKGIIIFGITLISIILVAVITVNLKQKNKDNKNEENIEDKIILSEEEALSTVDTLYYRFEHAFYRQDLTFDEENNNLKKYKLENKDYYKLTNFDYLRYMFTDNGFNIYKNLSGLIEKDNEYYLPVDIKDKDETLFNREFKIGNRSKDEISVTMISTYCKDKDTCKNQEKKTRTIILKKVDDTFKLDQFELDV